MLGFGYGSGVFLLGGERLRDGKVVEPDVPVLEELLPLLLARDLVRGIQLLGVGIGVGLWFGIGLGLGRWVGSGLGLASAP